jgi:hypothetical protein
MKCEEEKRDQGQTTFRVFFVRGASDWEMIVARQTSNCTPGYFFRDSNSGLLFPRLKLRVTFSETQTPGYSTVTAACVTVSKDTILKEKRYSILLTRETKPPTLTRRRHSRLDPLRYANDRRRSWRMRRERTWSWKCLKREPDRWQPALRPSISSVERERLVRRDG